MSQDCHLSIRLRVCLNVVMLPLLETVQEGVPFDPETWHRHVASTRDATLVCGSEGPAMYSRRKV